MGSKESTAVIWFFVQSPKKKLLDSKDAVGIT